MEKITSVETKDFSITIVEGSEVQIRIKEKTKNMYTYTRYKQIEGVKELEINFLVKSDDELSKMNLY